jgi:cytochrome d ubiquinol oxidase subunit II
MLETTWFVLWGVLWAIYFMLDGYDLGAGALMPFLAKTEKDRKKVYRAIEPFWDGNEVWLITAGGVTFAAFPGAYATLFSALYSPLMLILFALILRGAALALRGETQSAVGHKLWDVCFVLGSFLPALLFGVAFANLLQGIPVDGEGRFHGTILTLLNPQGLLGGVLFVILFMMHGALWLAMNTDGEVQAAADKAAFRLRAALVGMAFVFAAFLLVKGQLSNHSLPGFFPFAASALMVAPSVGLWGLIGKKSWGAAWWASSVGIVLTTLCLIVGMFPALAPSSLDPSFSATIENSASSPLTLKIMLGVALCTVPLVIAYQAWAYRLLGGGAEDGDTTSSDGY